MSSAHVCHSGRGRTQLLPKTTHSYAKQSKQTTLTHTHTHWETNSKQQTETKRMPETQLKTKSDMQRTMSPNPPQISSLRYIYIWHGVSTRSARGQRGGGLPRRKCGEIGDKIKYETAGPRRQTRNIASVATGSHVA